MTHATKSVVLADGTQVSLSYIVSYRVVKNKPVKLSTIME